MPNKKRDTDPHGISASMKFVKEMAEIDFEGHQNRFGLLGAMVFAASSDDLIKLIGKARRICKKFR